MEMESEKDPNVYLKWVDRLLIAIILFVVIYLALTYVESLNHTIRVYENIIYNQGGLEACIDLDGSRSYINTTQFEVNIE